MKVITKKQALLMHRELIAAHGGSNGVRDEGLLDSALSAPFQTFDGETIYPTIQQKATRLCHGLVKNRPFVDGNKRTGAHVTLVFLAMNGIKQYLADHPQISTVTLCLDADEAGRTATERIMDILCLSRPSLGVLDLPPKIGNDYNHYLRLHLAREQTGKEKPVKKQGVCRF